jgi:hypothetical protein
MSVTEMKMLRWMSGMPRENRIRNEYVRDSIVASILDNLKMRKNRVRWFEHVIMREETKAVTVFMKMNVEGEKGKPRKRWLDTIENDMRAVDVCVGDVENRDGRRLRTRVPHPK